MGTQLARASVRELKEKIKTAESRRNYFIKYTQELWQSYQAGKISHDFYIETTHKHFQGKTLKEWISFYDHHIEECKALISKHRKKRVKGHLTALIFSIFLILLIFFLVTKTPFQPTPTGFATEEPEINETVNRTVSTETIYLGNGKYKTTSYLGYKFYDNGSGYKEIDPSFVSYNQDGYDYTLNYTPYNLYVKQDSNFGDGVKYCKEQNGTEYCLIYQSQDYSYRNKDGSQDYISSIQNTQGIINGTRITYPNIHSGVNLTLITGNALLKENYVISSLVREPAEFLGDISNITLDFGGYIKYEGLDIYVNNSLMSGDFVTSEEIEFRRNNETLFYLPKPYAYDSNNSIIEIQYEVENQSGQIWFYVRTPYSWLNSSERVYPVYIDPSTGLKSPASTGEDYNDWTNPSNAFSSDDNDADTNLGSGDQQDYYDFSFGVPTDAAIDGIEVQVECEKGGVNDGRVGWELSWDGGTSYTSSGYDTTCGATEQYHTIGGSTDTWGRTWDDAETNNTNFRIRGTDEIVAKSLVDHIQINVYYTEAGGDEEAPKWSNNQTNSTRAGTTINHSVKWTDSFELEGYIFSFDNGTGSFVNDSYSTFSGTTNFSNVIKSVNSTVGSTIRWRVYANDTSDNQNVTDIFQYTTTVNTEPPSVTINQPENKTYAVSNMTFNITATDSDGSIIGCNYSLDNVENITMTNITTTEWNATNSSMADGFHTARFYCEDNDGALNDTEQVSFTVDTTPPNLVIWDPENSTTSTSSTRFRVAATDSSGISECNYTLDDVNRSLPHATLDFYDTTNSSMVEGFHTVKYSCNDTLGNLQDDPSIAVNFTKDFTAPFWQDNQTNSTSAGQSINHSVNWTDNFNLEGYIFSFDNGTGSFVNDSYVNFSSTQNFSNVIKIVNSTVGSTIRWRVYANDTVDNQNVTDIFQYTTTEPPANNIPTIPFVEAISAQDPTIGSTKSITFNFTAEDQDGTSDLDDSTASAYFQRSGETTRSNTSCAAGDTSGNQKNYTCTVDMWYFDQNGAWTINVTIKDNSAASAENSSTTFTYNLLTAMEMSPTSLTWPEINLPDTDTGSNNDPITINNSGNDEPLNINITAYNLRGEEITTEFIYAENFTVSNVTEGCSGTTMANATSTNVTSAILYRGNNSLNYNNATSGQEQIFFCLKGVPQDISSQSYSSSFYGAWEIRVLLVAIIPAARRRKKKKKEKQKQELTKNISIPATIFTKKLGALEAIVKYMKENLDMRYSEIAKALARDERTIWTAYQKAKEKQPEKIEIKEAGITIPVSILRNRKLTTLGAVILHLKSREMKYSEIAKALARDERNIWKIYQKAVDKLEEKELDLIKIEAELTIPATIFTKKLGALEAIVKYMKENLDMRYSEIAKALARDERTIWTAYQKAKEKQPEKIEIKEAGITIPVSIFNKLTILESLIKYLKEREFKFNEIADLLNRDQRNVWTTYSKVINKLNKTNTKE